MPAPVVASHEPVAVDDRYPEPSARVDPDRELGWVRRLWPLVWSHRRLLLISLSAALVAMLAQVAVPATIRQAIDRAVVAETDPLGTYLVVLGGLAVTRGLLSFVNRYGTFRLAYDLEYDLRRLLFDHLTTLSFSFYDRVQAGQIISRANSDIRSVQLFLAFAPSMALALTSFVIAVVFMLTIHVGLTIAAVAALPLVYVVGARLRNLVFPLSWIIQSRLADITGVVDESINGVRVVKSFAAERRQIEELARAAERQRWAALEQVDARARYAPLVESLPRVGLAAVLGYGGWLAIDGTVSIGTLVAFNAYVVLLQAPFRLLGFFLMLGQRARASAGRIFEILDEEPAVADRPDAVDLAVAVDGPVAGAVTFDGVRFGYGDGDDVLHHIDLDLAPGESVALVGRTGSGKSTVARLLPRFYEPRSGTVRIDGVDVASVTLTSLRRAVGVVTDEPFLFSASLHDNIAFARPDASPEDVAAAARAAQADEFIERLPAGYETVVGERGYTLSGGQRQRIAIARLILADPAVVVLDDATSAIDVQIEAQIHAGLDELLAGRTTLIVAHRLSSISLADRVVLLEDGRIAATGTHAELLGREPGYADIVAHFDDPARSDGTGVDGDLVEGRAS